jgi:hypothetical protein
MAQSISSAGAAGGKSIISLSDGIICQLPFCILAKNPSAWSATRGERPAFKVVHPTLPLLPAPCLRNKRAVESMHIRRYAGQTAPQAIHVPAILCQCH